MTYIYALLDPRTERVRYVGKSENLTRRLREHLADTSPCHRVHWLRQLSELNLLPTLVVLEQCSELNWQLRERDWIAFYRSIGEPLTNGTDGGEGGMWPTHAAKLGVEASRRLKTGFFDPTKKAQYASAAVNRVNRTSVFSHRIQSIGGKAGSRVTNSQKVQCECGMESTPGPIRIHQRATGHGQPTYEDV